MAKCNSELNKMLFCTSNQPHNNTGKHKKKIVLDLI